MKKVSLLAIVLLCATAHTAFSQVRLGLRFAPNVSYNRTTDLDNDDNLAVETKGAAIRFAVGPVLDYYFSDNYAFGTGLWYTLKTGQLQQRAGSVLNIDEIESSHNLQYLQIPLTLKAYTNEMGPGLKGYFQVGGTADVLIGENISEWKSSQGTEEPDADENFFRGFDLGAYLGIGVQLQMGETTFLYGGINYNRGLINALRDEIPSTNGSTVGDFREKVRSNLDVIGLEIGIML